MICCCVLLLVVLLVVRRSDAQSQGIDHVVAVMFENRAFDHMLGHLTRFNKNINGLTGNEWNPIDPANPSQGSQTVSFDADDTLLMNPGHTVPLTQLEMFGQNATLIDPAPMNGFIAELVSDGKHPVSLARQVMKCYNQTTVPTLSWLARNYAVFDSWFSSVPGPTMVNRMFAWSGTSNGYAQNSFVGDLFGFNQTSIFGQFTQSGVPHKIYYSDVPSPLVLDDVRSHPLSMHTISTFQKDAMSGKLPAFSWIDPRYFSIGPMEENDQHPVT